MKRKAKTLALLALGAVVVLGLLYWRFRPRDIDPPMTQSRTAPALHESERIIHFPEDEAIGIVYFHDGLGTPRDSGRIAKGLVTIPAGKHVTLSVDNRIHDLNRFAAFSAIGEAEKIGHLGVYNLNPRQQSDPTISSWLHHWTSVPSLTLKIDNLRADDLEGLEKLTSLRELVINVTEINDNDLIRIGKIRTLERLTLSGTGMTDSGLRHLASLQNLGDLRIYGSQIVGSGLAHLQGLTEIRLLALDNTPLVDDGVDHILTFPHLEALILNRTDISDVGLVKLARAPHLGYLDVRKTAVTRAGVLSFRRIAPHCSLNSDFPLPPTPTPKNPAPVS